MVLIAPGVIEAERIVLLKNPGSFCKLIYPNHKKGCPKYSKSKNCPPEAPPILDVLDTNKPTYIAFSTFDLASHVAKMKDRHPDWTDRQLKNVLYWQPKSRKMLKEKIKLAQELTGSSLVITCPEAMGVNVYITCRVSGLILEPIKYLNTCHHVALVGSKK